jgi:2,3,4,5-tetrahydropyridine-2,6-dicarboxylate N-succinyltransferase
MDHPSGIELLEALESGEVRAAEPTPEGWRVQAWVKQGILDIFRSSEVVSQGVEIVGNELDALARGRHAFRDKGLLTVRRFTDKHDVRLVPGGSAVRRGSYLAPGVVCMPPMYVNVGAWVGAGSMIDSHALIGSCAQVGEGVHVSAAAQIGGVLEPAGARPVIVEDGAFIGGNCGVYEGVLVGARAVLAAGTVLASGTVLYDLTSGDVLRGRPGEPLEVPPGAVVVPGTRALDGDFAREHGLSAACALIVKYRDERTDAATALEGALR